MKSLGMFLVVVGIGLMIFSGIRFFTTKKVAEVGKLEIKREEPHLITWSPYVGVGAVVIGGVIFMMGVKKV